MKLVSVVMAVYRPNIQFLKKQLVSIREQTYSNIELIIRDDSNDGYNFRCIKEVVDNTIKDKIKYKLIANESNIGSNKTFERLTLDAKGDFIAYCDQDDIWDKDKISLLMKKIIEEKSTMSYSDLSIIDESDEITSDSLRHIRKRLKHVYGKNKFKYLIRKNSVTGCTMLIRSYIAKESVPFPECYVHDQWLAINASMLGNISYIKKPLVKYRIHDNNQIGASKLVGIQSSKDYLHKRLYLEYSRYDFLLNNEKIPNDIKNYVGDLKRWTINRINIFKSKKISYYIKFIRGFRYDYQLFMFELLFSFIDENFQNNLINVLRKTKL